MKTLGQRMKESRTRMSMSQAEAAKRLYVSRSYYGYMERDESVPPDDILERIVLRMGITLPEVEKG